METLITIYAVLMNYINKAIKDKPQASITTCRVDEAAAGRALEALL